MVVSIILQVQVWAYLSTTMTCGDMAITPLAPYPHPFVKALQGLGMLDVSVVLWVQGFSEFKWVGGSDEGTSPN